ncbi:hypothetical protein Ade02nite_06280 [Paractinoplanes deccanensis]|uniref:Uncharacterized protein n=1 Tax=Paractinoplanes deccanensis TaxID=113561 RepID=A0ABQ3XW75_9ACTN|nr:hypothetical protein [Actinoplanes deccanensis]GID71987.1 hypothetical protein Ade02nite_06280 [Actinoplanes deccanensis]
MALQAPVEPAPTNVQVAWASSTHDQVVVTWDETGDLRNRVEAVRADGSSAGFYQLYSQAGQPNRLVVDKEQIRVDIDRDLRVAVTAVDASGNPLSEAGLSPVFDTGVPPAPVITAVEPRADGTIKATWTPGQAGEDTTPNDPLDVPAEVPPRFVPVTIGPGDPYEEGPASTATSFVFEGPANTVTRVGAHTVNEWTTNAVLGWTATASYGDVAATRIAATIPKTAPKGGKLTVTGTVTLLRLFCDMGLRCWEDVSADSGRLVRLESRTGAGAAWQTVATTTTDANGKFTVSVTFPGTRDYRVVAPIVVGTSEKLAKAPFATPPVTTKARAAS